jgi:DNA repair protein RecN (Recombination protein N)
MLTTLRIRNLALVADLNLELSAGFNAVTGETGAGKSVILGAVKLLLGQRADRSLIRTGTDACTVEASFQIPALRAVIESFLSQNGLEPNEDGQLILKRSFSAAGTNRQFVNGSPATLATLAALGELLVDLHGPHEHQSLLQPAKQLSILDAFGGLTASRDSLADLLRQRNSLRAEKASLIVDERTYAQQLDLLRFQVREITEANLRADEETEVEAEFTRATHSARLLSLAQSSLAGLSESDDSVLAQFSSVGKSLHELRRIDATGAELAELHEQGVATLRELQSRLARYADRIEIEPERLNELEERLSLIHSLKRKYGSTLTEVLAFADEARSRLNALESRDAEVARLDRAILETDAQLTAAAKALGTARRRLIPKLSKAVAEELAGLGFPRSSFDIRLTDAPDVTAAGGDLCEFQFAPNPGEPARPLRAIASSGELARVMLALKTVLAAEDAVPVLIFDEVDANIGGETARAVGQRIHRIAQRHQVLCITHLAPVAAAGDAHYVVTKELVSGRAESRIRKLEPDERVDELARMLGGASAAAKRHAEELLKIT